MSDRENVNPYRLLLDQADGEEIEAVVIGEAGMVLAQILELKMAAPVPQEKLSVPLSIEEARPFLDYEVCLFDVHNVHPVVVWTASWVISIPDVDGPIRAVRVPRNPRAGNPPDWRENAE
jgi:hypothetical protein